MEIMGFVFGMMGFTFGLSAIGVAASATGKIDKLEQRLKDAGVFGSEKPPD